jgi:hypothetical protein
MLRHCSTASYEVIPGLKQAEVSDEAKANFHELSRKLISSIDHNAPEQVHLSADNKSNVARRRGKTNDL